MTLYTLGAVPGGQLHPGLRIALDELEIRLGEVNGLAAGAQAALEAQLTIDPLAIIAGFEAGLDVAAGAEFDIVARLEALVLQLEADFDALIDAAAELSASLGTLNAALQIGSLHVWTWDGAAGKAGPALAEATAGGFGSSGPDADTFAVILATSSPTTWATLSGALYTAWGTDEFGPAADPGIDGIKFNELGSIPGTGLLLQVNASLPFIQGKIDALADAAAEFAANLLIIPTFGISIGFAAGIAASISAGISVGIPDVAISAQLAADIVLYLGIAASLGPFVAELRATISGGGAHLWSYRGPASALGSEFAAETSRGIAGGAPGDRSFGLVIATNSPTDFAALGAVLKVE